MTCAAFTGRHQSGAVSNAAAPTPIVGVAAAWRMVSTRTCTSTRPPTNVPNDPRHIRNNVVQIFMAFNVDVTHIMELIAFQNISENGRGGKEWILELEDQIKYV